MAHSEMRRARPAEDGAEIVNGVADRVRTEMYHTGDPIN